MTTLPANNLSAEASVGLRLHGQLPPKHILSEEEPWHYAAAMMFARGEVTQKEVANAFGVAPSTIRNLLRQPWFQERVLTLMGEHGGRDVMALFKAECINSLAVLVDIRDDDKAPKAVRHSSAVAILDRALGKPKQFVETADSPSSADPVAEVAMLQERNRRIRDSLFGNDPLAGEGKDLSGEGKGLSGKDDSPSYGANGEGRT